MKDTSPLLDPDTVVNSSFSHCFALGVMLSNNSFWSHQFCPASSSRLYKQMLSVLLIAPCYAVLSSGPGIFSELGSGI